MDPNLPTPQGDNANTGTTTKPEVQTNPVEVDIPPIPESVASNVGTPFVNPTNQPANTSMQPPTQPSQEPVVKKNSTISIIALVVFLFAIICLAGYFLYTKYLNGAGTKEAANTATTPEPVVATPTPDPTADWETYTNTQYKFSFKYPSNLTQTTLNGFDMAAKNDKYTLSLKFDSDSSPYESTIGIIKEKNDSSDLSVKVSQVNDRSVYFESQTSAEGYFARSVYIPLTSGIIVLDVSSNKELSGDENSTTYTEIESVADLIISTFQFTEPSKLPSSSIQPTN